MIEYINWSRFQGGFFTKTRKYTIGCFGCGVGKGFSTILEFVVLGKEGVKGLLSTKVEVWIWGFSVIFTVPTGLRGGVAVKLILGAVEGFEVELKLKLVFVEGLEVELKLNFEVVVGFVVVEVKLNLGLMEEGLEVELVVVVVTVLWL